MPTEFLILVLNWNKNKNSYLGVVLVLVQGENSKIPTAISGLDGFGPPRSRPGPPRRRFFDQTVLAYPNPFEFCYAAQNQGPGGCVGAGGLGLGRVDRGLGSRV